MSRTTPGTSVEKGKVDVGSLACRVCGLMPWKQSMMQLSGIVANLHSPPLFCQLVDHQNDCTTWRRRGCSNSSIWSSQQREAPQAGRRHRQDAYPETRLSLMRGRAASGEHSHETRRCGWCPLRGPPMMRGSLWSGPGFFAGFRRTESRKSVAHWKEKAQPRDLGRPAVSN